MKIGSQAAAFTPITLLIETQEEAQAFAEVVGRIGGDPTGQRRPFAMIADALDQRGIKYTDDGATGTIIF